MRIRFLVVLLPLFLAGCGLPPAIVAASYVADGLLLVTTGKSSTDHALSFATGEDCAMWRVVEGEAICSELTPEGGSQIALEKADDLPADTPAPEPGGASPGQVAAAPRGAITSETLPPPSVATGPNDTPETIGTLRPEDRVAATDHDRLGTPAATAAPASLLPANATPAAGPVAPLAMPQDAPRLVAVADPAAPPFLTAAGAATPTLPAGHYFVLASYRERGNAERHLARLDGLSAHIMPAEVDGIAYYRVLAGPFAPGQRAGAEAELAQAGMADHWPLDLCGDCAGASQIASAE
jgi:hypothetical protein